MDRFRTSEYKVTYLLGAGASAKVLPTVKRTTSNEGFSSAMRGLSHKLRTNDAVRKENKLFAEELAEDALWLAEKTDMYGTPDTYAKFLSLKEDHTNLKRLKRITGLFFAIEQFVYNQLDDRALIFLTTVMQHGNMFPPNIKILNWNYDFQIQSAAENFRHEEFSPGKVNVHSPPLISYYPSLGNEMIVNHQTKIDDTEYSMVHLNGIAGFYLHHDISKFLSLYHKKELIEINQMIENVVDVKYQRTDLLTFAWENEQYLRNKLVIAKKIVEKTDILVIIGYSFPFFNREIDKEIFRTLKNNKGLKKIYYQDPYRTGEFLKKQFNLYDEIEIEHVKEIDNYYVPFEL